MYLIILKLTSNLIEDEKDFAGKVRFSDYKKLLNLKRPSKLHFYKRQNELKMILLIKICLRIVQFVLKIDWKTFYLYD